MSVPAKREAEATPVAVAEPVSMESVLARAIADPNIDPERLSKFLDLHERMTNRNAIIAFTEAMKAAQEAMPAVIRDAENNQTNSKYVRLETLADAIDPVIHAHGFTPSYGTDDSPLSGHYRVTCRLRHVGGHTEDYFADVPADMHGMKGNQNKTATHAFGSTMSYGRRYLKLMIFDVKVKGQDDDGNRAGGRSINDAQVRTLDALITAAGADRPAFLKYLRVERLEDLPENRFQAALAGLNAKKRQAAQQQAGGQR